MFFTPRINISKSGGFISFSKDTVVDICDSNVKNYIESTVNSKLLGGEFSSEAKPCIKLTFAIGIPDNVKTKISKLMQYADNDEEYIVIIGEETYVYAKEPRGLVFGLSTIMQLIDSKELSCRFIYDYPTCKVRGYRVYLPGTNHIDIFKDMVDLLAYYKYNSIIMEIGGAMEYKKHPEINKRWIEFCADVHRYSGRSKEIQFHTYPWEKNSIHCDNGEGEVLTQEQCADLAQYCRDRGIEVIPECPTYSHSDYIVQAHPELRERMEDDYADTYCPCHPDTYKIVFEILDEVIEVFHPKQINIGHDELYSVGVCDRCKDKDPVDLYISDVTKIKDYLKSKGIGTLMWGEKLLKAVSKQGKKYGGWYDVKTRNGGTYQIPSLYTCADKMPKDVTFLHWYWSFDPALDDVYHKNGYNVIFGNFNALGCEQYKKRVAKGIKGGFVSNWGSNEDEYMQRNLQYVDLMGTAYAFWGDDYDYEYREEYLERVMHEAYRKHYEGKKNLIKVVHTTDLYIPFEYKYDGIFIYDEKYLLGHYELSYSDGTSVLFPVKYGTNITTCNIKENLCEDQNYLEVESSTLPKCYNGKYFYECGFENPYPEKVVCGFRYIPLESKKDVKIYIKSIKFMDGKTSFIPDDKEKTESAHIFQ